MHKNDQLRICVLIISINNSASSLITYAVMKHPLPQQRTAGSGLSDFATKIFNLLPFFNVMCDLYRVLLSISAHPIKQLDERLLSGALVVLPDKSTEGQNNESKEGNYGKCNFPMPSCQPVCRIVNSLVGQLVSYNSLKGWEVTLPFSFRSPCLTIYIFLL